MTKYENIEKLAKSFGVSERAVRYALAGERTGELSQRIRIMAIQLEPIEEVYEPSPNEYIMSWENGAVQLRYRKNENDAQIVVNGEPKAEPRTVTCAEFNNMRKQCERIAINM